MSKSVAEAVMEYANPVFWIGTPRALGTRSEEDRIGRRKQSLEGMASR